MNNLNEIEKGQICDSAVQCFSRADGSLKTLPGLIKKIIRNKAWERRVTRKRVIELGSLYELITAKPIEGWGEDPKKIEAVIKNDPEALAMFREEMNGRLLEHGRPKKEEGEQKGCGSTFISDDQGNEQSDTESAASVNKRGDNSYWQARIQRDCPEELEAIKSGEKRIIDIRRERGWIAKTKRVTLTGDPSTDRQRLIDAWGQDYLKGLFQ